MSDLGGAGIGQEVWAGLGLLGGCGLGPCGICGVKERIGITFTSRDPSDQNILFHLEFYVLIFLTMSVGCVVPQFCWCEGKDGLS